MKEAQNRVNQELFFTASAVPNAALDSHKPVKMQSGRTVRTEGDGA